MMPTLLNNRYKIIQALAIGGFGQTFLAEDTHLPSRRRCVIKQLKPVMNNPQAHQLVQQRFQREATILEKLGESNDQIPQLYAYFEEAGQFYLVQEWIEGQTLAAKVQAEGRLSDRIVQNFLLNLLPVLDFIHSQGIIHRDIKPDNIILRQKDDQPILIDFGAVKEIMTTVVNSQGNPTHSMVIGTPGFMPPEQASGKPIYSSDLYSLGLTAIYLLTGKLPQELGIDSQTGEWIWRQYAPNINPKLAAVLERTIRSHPRDRYSTARQMLNDLQSSPTAIPAVTPSQQATLAVSPGGAYRQPVQSIPSGEWKKAAAIAGSLIATSLIIGFVLTRTRQPASTSRSAPEPSAVQRTIIAESTIAATPRQTVQPAKQIPDTFPPSETRQPSPSVSNPDTPSLPKATISTPITPPIYSPVPTPTETIQSTSIPPGFPIGTSQEQVEETLGKPTKISPGAWGNTRAFLYEDYVPGKISLGYLFDRQSRQLRQTEAALSQSLDLEQMQAILNQMLDGRAHQEIRQKLRRVYQRQLIQSSFNLGDLKGLIQRNKSDRIYIGIWDADLH